MTTIPYQSERFHAAARLWANDHELSLFIHNNCGHWQFVGRRGFMAEWWPTTGKFVVNEEWGKGCRIRDTAILKESIFAAYEAYLEAHGRQDTQDTGAGMATGARRHSGGTMPPR